jgi:hypothetical protein
VIQALDTVGELLAPSASIAAAGLFTGLWKLQVPGSPSTWHQKCNNFVLLASAATPLA